MNNVLRVICVASFIISTLIAFNNQRKNKQKINSFLTNLQNFQDITTNGNDSNIYIQSSQFVSNFSNYYENKGKDLEFGETVKIQNRYIWCFIIILALIPLGLYHFRILNSGIWDTAQFSFLEITILGIIAMGLAFGNLIFVVSNLKHLSYKNYSDRITATLRIIQKFVYPVLLFVDELIFILVATNLLNYNSYIHGVFLILIYLCTIYFFKLVVHHTLINNIWKGKFAVKEFFLSCLPLLISLCK